MQGQGLIFQTKSCCYVLSVQGKILKLQNVFSSNLSTQFYESNIIDEDIKKNIYKKFDDIRNFIDCYAYLRSYNLSNLSEYDLVMISFIKLFDELKLYEDGLKIPFNGRNIKSARKNN